MPYVHRGTDGRIANMFPTSQPKVAEEFLADDNAEVMAFRSSPLSLKELINARGEWTENDEKHEPLRNAILDNLRAWAELETALSALLHVILDLNASHLAYAIYYSPPSAAARLTLVDNAVSQFIDENAAIAGVAPVWNKIKGKIDTLRRTRNAVAHGTPHTLKIAGKDHVRLTSPAFDVIRAGRRTSAGEIPGVGAEDLCGDNRKTTLLVECVNDLCRVMAVFQKSGPGSVAELLEPLQEKLAGLRR